MLRRALILMTAVTFLFAFGSPGDAQGARPATGRLHVVVKDALGNPLAGAEVRVLGPTSSSALTAANGTYSETNLQPGLYTVVIVKSGFVTASEPLTIVAGDSVTESVELANSTLSTIETIGRTSTAVNGPQMNTSSSAVATLSGSAFTDQGQLTVNRALNELPGVEVGFTNNFYNNLFINGASTVAIGVPTIRGALPYESQSLIDGHPINIGLSGEFNPAFLSPYILQDVEVAKGPGATPTNIFNAVNGTINFRTLQPTAQPKSSATFGGDQFGGTFGNFRATGTVGRLGYAADYASQGTNGPQRGFAPYDPLVLFGAGGLINGQPVCGNPAAAAGCGIGIIAPGKPGYVGPSNVEGLYDFTSPLIACCRNIPMSNDTRNELLKLSYAFTPSTSFTTTYLGGQINQELGGAFGYFLPYYFFYPPAGYSGAVAPYTPTLVDTQDPGFNSENVNLFSGELRTSLGQVALNARYYSAADNNYLVRGAPTPYSFNEMLWGGVPLGNSTTPTFFNGQTVTLTDDFSVNQIVADRLSGYTVQAAMPVGDSSVSVSYDYVHTSDYANQTRNGVLDVTLYPGSGQNFQTLLAQGEFKISPRLDAKLADYQTYFEDRYTQDLGLTFQDTVHAYNAPRVSLTYRPSAQLSTRFAAGYSITPPYLGLLENSAPTILGGGGVYATVTNNSGAVSPETAFGVDLGSDLRLSRDTVLSADVYENTLQNQFLTQTALSKMPLVVGPNNPFNVVPGSYPLYVTSTANLGHSRFEGIELSLKRQPRRGLGFTLQGSLQRAYVYDLPANFYATQAGPYTTNLAILPNENFSTSGNAFNGISDTRVPYSQGYAELNFRWRSGAAALIGATYYGPNNGYNEPAFAVVNGSFTQPIGRNIALRLSVTNITGAYTSIYPNYYGGVPEPLADGKIGYTIGNVVGPSTASLSLATSF